MLAGTVIVFSSLGLARRDTVRALGDAWTCLWPLALSVFYLVQPLRLPIWASAALVAGIGGTVWLCTRIGSGPRISQPEPGTKARSGLAWLGDVLVFLMALVLYLSTLAPSVLPGDSGEFQFAAPTLSIPHPTGYPFYLLLGKLLSLLPIGSVAYRLNLLSALAAAGAVWAIYRAGRALRLRWPAAMLGASLVAVSSTLWSQATIADKYALNAFFVAATLWLGLQWRRTHLASPRRISRRWLYAWTVCYGLSLTHHRTMLLLAPAYALLVWTTDRTLVRDRRLVLRLLLLVLAPLSLYLLLPLFSALNPPYAYQRIDSVSAFLDLVLARAFRGLLFRGGWRGLWPRLIEGGRLLVRQFGWPGLAVSVLGIGVLWRRDRHVAGMLLLGMAAQFLFALNYYVPNTYVYYLPVYVWLAVCASACLDVAQRTTQSVTVNVCTNVRSDGYSYGQEMAEAAPTKSWTADEHSVACRNVGHLGMHLTLACLLLAAAWVVHLASSRWAGMDQGRAYGQQPFDYQYGQLAARSVEEGALIVGDWMPATVLWYTQYVEGLMPKTQVTVSDPLDSLWQGPVESALAAGRPVYLARPVMAAGERYALSSAGPLVQVLGERRFTAPDLGYPGDAAAAPGAAAGSFRPEISLLGANLAASGAGPESKAWVELAAHMNTPVQGGSVLHATLVWQARRAPQGDYEVRVRWVDASGRVWREQQNRHPVGGAYPTSRWQEGEVVADYYALDLPAYLGTGEYRLQAALALPGASDPDWIMVATVGLVAAPGGMPSLGTQVRKAFGGGWVLTGYDAPPEWVPGEIASVALQWLYCATTDRSTAQQGRPPRLWLVDGEGTARAVEPLAGAQSQPPQMAKWFRFIVDDDLARVEVREPTPLGLGRARIRLPVRVAKSSPGTNFGDKIRLRDADYDANVYHPGATVRLTLKWEAMRPMDEAYKVFVHVLGPNGLPIAQQDNEPLNGTYPTTRWQQGERVSDPYAIALPADLAPGEYAVEVGLYRISDLTRLPVLGPDQEILDDKLYLVPLVIR